MFCNHCGKPAEESQRFCSQCGNNLKKGMRATCRSCGAQAEEDAKFCNVCGAALEHSAASQHKRYCAYCGERFENEHLYCRSCGKPLEHTAVSAPLQPAAKATAGGTRTAPRVMVGLPGKAPSLTDGCVQSKLLLYNYISILTLFCALFLCWFLPAFKLSAEISGFFSTQTKDYHLSLGSVLGDNDLIKFLTQTAGISAADISMLKTANGFLTFWGFIAPTVCAIVFLVLPLIRRTYTKGGRFLLQKIACFIYLGEYMLYVILGTALVSELNNEMDRDILSLTPSFSAIVIPLIILCLLFMMYFVPTLIKKQAEKAKQEAIA